MSRIPASTPAMKPSRSSRRASGAEFLDAVSAKCVCIGRSIPGKRVKEDANLLAQGAVLGAIEPVPEGFSREGDFQRFPGSQGGGVQGGREPLAVVAESL